MWRLLNRLLERWLAGDWRRPLYVGLVAGMGIGWLVMVLVRSIYP